MRTLYIDVYFLINFTVDLLSLYFAAMFSKTPTTSKRIIISALIGAMISVVAVLSPEVVFLKLIIAFIGLIIMGSIAPKPMSVHRKFKFTVAFVIFNSLTGAAVTFFWDLFDKHLSVFLKDITGTRVNRKILFLSIILLLLIGVFRMIVSFFSSNETENNCMLEINFMKNRILVEAFVDTGNLAVDPMDMSPVLLIKEGVAKEILPKEIINLCDIDSFDKSIKKRIRLVPISSGDHTRVLVGFKADSVCVIQDNIREEIRVTIVIDKDGGTFGGYEALMPSAALSDVY